tara:strand:+ start:84 stop:1205 length:1122 start_codon:yes stop_codon:yes gene_type:complete
MGAGTSTDHFMQDAAEAYIVFKLQELAVNHDVALTDNVGEKFSAFLEYCQERDISQTFADSVYKANIDATVEQFFADIVARYPNKQFDIVDVEKDFRDLKLKGDFIIYFGQGDYISISLKNYKNGFDRIQLCSGTWNSFLNNFLFESDGVGMFINPITNKRFKGSNRAVRDQLVEEIGFAPLAPIYSMFDNILDEVRTFYVTSEEANQWSNVATRWKNDCSKYGQQAAQSIVDALNNLDNDKIKQRVIQMAGLTYEEEILLIGKGKYCCSIFNDKYAEILRRVNSDESVVEYKVNGKGVLFTITDGTEIVSIEVPFTLQKNGAWNLCGESYEGTVYHKKEKMDLAYGQRRPKKSKEIATSINTYLDLKKAGVC